MIPDAHIAHSSPGRIRVKIPAHRGNTVVLEGLCGHLRNYPGVSSAAANPITGSILILHETDPEAIMAYARTQGLFSPQGEVRRKPEVQRIITSSVSSADRSLRRLTSGDMDIRMLSVLFLIAAGLFDLLQGSFVAMPWYAAFWYAFNVFVMKQPEAVA
jgi:hypothetical protein